MSVSPSLSDLYIATPPKQYVDNQITGWMQTNSKENSDYINVNTFKIRNTQFINRKIKTRNQSITRQTKRVIKENMFIIMKSHRAATIKSKELFTPRINCKLNIGKYHDSDLHFRGNSWHNKPLIKSKYKFKQDSFKNHLTNKSIEIIQHDLTPNQKLMISQIIHKKTVFPQSKFR